MTQIKICGITNLADALHAAAAGADALGFNFYRKSSRYIEPDEARRIIEQLPPEILCVGVFVNEAQPADVRRVAAQAGVTAVQLHGDESPAYVKSLTGTLVIKALRVDDDFQPEDAGRFETDAVLLDAFHQGARGGTGKIFNWMIAQRTKTMVARLYLAGGLTPENVAEAIKTVEPFAVDTCSGVERAPGQKDARRLHAFVAAVRRATRPIEKR